MKAQQKQSETDLLLKKYAVAYFAEKATVKAVVPVDNEPAADKQELKALIRQEAKSETNDLRKQLEEMKQALNALSISKNEQKRGSVSALNKKQTTNRSSEKTTTTKSNNGRNRNNNNRNNNQRKKEGKVEDVNKESSAAKRNSKKKTGSASSKQNKASSNGKKRTPSKKSNRK